MKSFRKTLPLCCLALTIGSGVLRGRIDQRWGPTAEMQAAAEALQTFPSEVGPWQATGAFKSLDEATVRMLRCTGNIYCEYVNRESGEQLSVILMYGPSGPLAVHTPDVCYSSSNFTQQEERRRLSVKENEREHQFWSIQFEENAAGNRPLQVIYGWKQGASWTAPHEARTAFAGVPVLHKIQVASHHSGDAENPGAGVQFLRDALPLLDEICRDSPAAQ